jgi:hypothetical protein
VIASNIRTFTNKRSPINKPTTSNSDRLKYPHFHEQAIATQQTNNTKTAIAPNLIQKAIA